MQAKRVRYFDIAKGIAILCVVLGHSALIARGWVPSRLADWLTSFCFSFHMPLFFLLSGYFMHPGRAFRWRRESTELLLTYAITACAVVAGGAMFSALLDVELQPEAGLRVAKSWAEAAFYGAGDVSPLTLWPVENRIGAVWFLLALFWAHLLLHWCWRFRMPMIPVVACFVIGYVSSRMVWLPWSIQAGMCAVLFLYIGQLAREHRVLDWLDSHRWMWLMSAVLWVADIIWARGLSMAINQYGPHPALAVVGSLAGTICIIGLSRLVDTHVDALGRVLSLAGRTSLAILCVHLVEDDVFPWGRVLAVLQSWNAWVPMTISFFLIRLALDVACAAVLYRIPVVNRWFYPQLSRVAGNGDTDKMQVPIQGNGISEVASCH
ncbi:acyltransferase family protein [Bifidobacterium pullorum]|uniref:acyltransferase family protein n=1 Tax=Bifidobacterium pullorum TaxID=78448 RepID=UPI0009DE1FB4|nr:acyltransferase family protein [Bifidobacterium pullorum]